MKAVLLGRGNYQRPRQGESGFGVRGRRVRARGSTTPRQDIATGMSYRTGHARCGGGRVGVVVGVVDVVVTVVELKKAEVELCLLLLLLRSRTEEGRCVFHRRNRPRRARRRCGEPWARGPFAGRGRYAIRTASSVSRRQNARRVFLGVVGAGPETKNGNGKRAGQVCRRANANASIWGGSNTGGGAWAGGAWARGEWLRGGGGVSSIAAGGCVPRRAAVGSKVRAVPDTGSAAAV
jgi:hypothetical protein